MRRTTRASPILRQKLLAEGKTEPRYHPISRPAGMEVEAIERALALADAADCPAYIVHISTGRGRGGCGCGA